MARHFSSPVAAAEAARLPVSSLSFVGIKYELSTTWVMCYGCGLKTGAFANLSVIMNLLLTCSGILGLLLRGLISKNSKLNADVSITHLSSLGNHSRRSCLAQVGPEVPRYSLRLPLTAGSLSLRFVCFLLTVIHGLRRTCE